MTGGLLIVLWLLTENIEFSHIQILANITIVEIHTHLYIVPQKTGIHLPSGSDTRLGYGSLTKQTKVGRNTGDVTFIWNIDLQQI